MTTSSMTNVAKRARVRENALYLVFKIVEGLSGSRRVLSGGATVMKLGKAIGKRNFQKDGPTPTDRFKAA